MLNLFDIEVQVAEHSRKMRAEMEHYTKQRQLAEYDDSRRPAVHHGRIRFSLAGFQRWMKERMPKHVAPGPDSVSMKIYCVCTGTNCACARAGMDSHAWK